MVPRFLDTQAVLDVFDFTAGAGGNNSLREVSVYPVEVGGVPVRMIILTCNLFLLLRI